MEKIMLFLMLITSIKVNSQTSIGLNTGFSGATYFAGYNFELVMKMKRDNHYFQTAIGSEFFNNKNNTQNKDRPAWSAYFQFGNQISRNTKRLFWINNINLTYGTKRPADIHVIHYAYICTTVKMGLTLNTGLEYQILKREKFDLFGNFKIGFGKAFLVEEIHPEWMRPCDEGSHLMSRMNLGFLLTYNL